jgi:hypothetical protein
MRGRALQQHPWSYVRDVAGRIEPLARAERAVEQEQWLLGQVSDLQGATPAEPTLPRQHAEVVDGIEEPVPEAIVGHDKGHVNITVFEPAQQAQPAIFDEVHLHAGMTASVLAQEPRERVLDGHRRRPDTEDSGVSALERASSRTEQLRVHQQSTALPEQVLTLRRQPETPADPVEEAHTQLGFQREDLARRRRLAHGQPSARPRYATGLGDAHERVEMAEVHLLSISASRI